MQYDFDEIIDRRGTACVKHDLAKKVFGTEDLTPMWVADMDFKAPDFIIEAIRSRSNHEILGYTFGSESYVNAIKYWFRVHYGIVASDKEIHFIPGIVAGISFCIEAFTQKGDKILVFNPVYPPFNNLPAGSGRELVVSKLLLDSDGFSVDYEDFALKARGCKMFILSNPHNPGGHVWSLDDLQKIATICRENNIIVISDEIHADLTFPGYTHHSFSTVSDDARDISLTFIAPSKTFNIAGLGTSSVYIHNQEIRNIYFNYIDTFELANGNVFAYVGAEAAFSHNGEKWLDQLKQYLVKNIAFVEEFLKKEMPLVKAVIPKASYLVWLDFRKYNIPHDELKRLLVEKAKVGLNSGPEFGKGYEGFMRMNIGCPLSVLKDAMNRIATSLNCLIN